MKVIIINGPMGVGKTTTGKCIADSTPGTALIDGDWCMDLHPFVGNRETRAMAVDNILHMIGNYRKCSECRMVVLVWLMDDPWVYDSLLDGLATSRAFADGSVWAVREDEVEALRHINQWITELTASARFNRMQKRYFSGKTVSLTSISQYDNILRQSADSIGWDWRLLAAVVYHESRFHNDANSSKGALGLMQIRSKRYTAEMLLNPSANITVGSRYLKKLENMFSDTASDPVEATKFALAAYNMGEGKLAQLIEQAQEQGMDPSRWDNLKTLLPEGHHTRAYVENVLNTYSYYSKLYPR